MSFPFMDCIVFNKFSTPRVFTFSAVLISVSALSTAVYAAQFIIALIVCSLTYCSSAKKLQMSSLGKSSYENLNFLYEKAISLISLPNCPFAPVINRWIQVINATSPLLLIALTNTSFGVK